MLFITLYELFIFFHDCMDSLLENYRAIVYEEDACQANCQSIAARFPIGRHQSAVIGVAHAPDHLSKTCQSASKGQATPSSVIISFLPVALIKALQMSRV